jgi:hypothetical protein
MVKIAIENSLIYRKIFGCIPDNSVIHYQDITVL